MWGGAGLRWGMIGIYRPLLATDHVLENAQTCHYSIEDPQDPPMNERIAQPNEQGEWKSMLHT